jgi:membrane-bound metal-dependent hydrolase YbcI (DUF457 family)
MMSYSHSASGAMAWAALCAAGPLVGVHSSPLAVGAGLFAVAGGALLPDTDHPEASIAHFAPPVSRGLCKAVNHLSGGHRHGTHTLLAVPAFALVGLIPQIIAWSTGATWAPLVLLWLLYALAVRALHLAPRQHGGGGALIAAVATLIVWQLHVNLWWLPLACGLGALVHILGDMLTVEGVPLFWPACSMHNAPGWTRVPILGHTDSRREVDVFAPLMVLGTAALVSIPLW